MEVLRSCIFTCLMVLHTSVILQGQRLAVDAQAEPFLLYSSRTLVGRANLDGSNRELIVNITASGLDFDYTDKTIFYSNIKDEKIYRSSIDGSFQTIIVDSDIENPEIIAWDWVNKKLYWTDGTKGTVEVIDPITGYRKVLLDLGSDSKPRGLVLDPLNRSFYWSTWGKGLEMIGKTSMDGSNTTIVHNSSVVTWPNALALNSVTGELFWLDANRNTLAKSKTIKNSPTTILRNFTGSFNPFHATFFSGVIYYTEWINNHINSVPVVEGSGTDQTLITTDMDPITVHVYGPNRQPQVSNHCGSNNGGCSNLCLLSSTDPRGYSCACAGEIELNTDGRTCGVVVVEPETTSTIPQTTTEATASPCDHPDVCQNGGTCHDVETDLFICVCPSGYSGKRCESGQLQGDDNIVLIYVLGVLGILAFIALVMVGLILFVYATLRLRAKKDKKHHQRRSSIDGLSTSSRDSPTHFVLVNGRMGAEHDYMSIKSRGNSPAPSRILICNVGDSGNGAIPNNYIFEPRPAPLPTGASQNLVDNLVISQRNTDNEPIYNTLKSTKTQTL